MTLIRTLTNPAKDRAPMMMTRLAAVSVIVLSLAACTPVGMATGAGAAAGIATAQEGGIRGAASDIAIKAKISDLWFKYDLKTFAKLSMTVDQGRVLITGVVQDPESRVEAVRLAWQVEGVKQVINEIRVADSAGVPGFVRDTWISTRLRTALTFDGDVRSINYSIETVQGTVYLMGVAHNQQELDRVMEIARTIPNVKQVVSYVKMYGEAVNKPGATPAWQNPVTSQTPSTPSIQPAKVAPVDREPVEKESLGQPTW